MGRGGVGRVGGVGWGGAGGVGRSPRNEPGNEAWEQGHPLVEYA